MKAIPLLIVTTALLLSGVVQPAAALEKKTSPAREKTVSQKVPTGRWKEFWSPNEKTDVTYHDEYRIGIEANGKATVAITTRQQVIANVSYDSGDLHFTLTTTFPVKFALRLAPDGKSFTGTATTPKKIFEVRWEKIE